ncbi:MAG: large membrane associated protein, partial [Herbiconiux sp.]|nr:large membrane associated protein [Herbiconiux sp.]
GPHAWNELQGGECLTGFTSPWVEEFTVADCAGEHTAQLVTTGVFTDDAAAAYPGEAALVAQLNLLCTAPAVLDYAVAGQYPDLAWQSSYPTDEAQWTAGDHRYYCFYARSGGEPITGSLQSAPVG